MARIRSVHPDICISEKMAGLSADLERTFVRLWTHCDDEGRCIDNPKLIKAALFPLHDDVTADVVNEHLEGLEDEGLLRRYIADGQWVLEVCSFGEFQHPKRFVPSKLPAHPGPTTEPEAPQAPTPAPDAGNNAATTRPQAAAVVVVGEGVGEGGGVAPAKRAREPDHLWDAMLDACGIAPNGITDSARGAYNRAVKDLRSVNATPQQIHERAAVYREKWPETSCTPSALARHWAELEPAHQAIVPTTTTQNLMKLRSLREAQ